MAAGVTFVVDGGREVEATLPEIQRRLSECVDNLARIVDGAKPAMGGGVALPVVRIPDGSRESGLDALQRQIKQLRMLTRALDAIDGVDPTGKD